MVKQLITKIKPMIAPMINILLIIATLTVLYMCSCRVYKKQAIALAKTPITQTKYKDLDLVELNEKSTHMKPVITDPLPKLTDQELKRVYTEIPNDYRFNICGESKAQDPRLENTNYDQPLGLMCRKMYRKNISEPIIDNLDKITLVRGHKHCKV
jgi:hypothetical protein